MFLISPIYLSCERTHKVKTTEIIITFSRNLKAHAHFLYIYIFFNFVFFIVLSRIEINETHVNPYLLEPVCLLLISSSLSKI